MTPTLALALAQLAGDPIVVTGRGLSQEATGQAETVIERDRLDQAASGRMEDVLRSVAGLTSFRRSDARSSHPTSQGLTARGLGGNAASRFAVELDGVPQADPFGGWINFIALDPALIDRVVVARGGQGGVGFGPGAVAGTLAIDILSSLTDGLRGAIAVGSRESLSGSLAADVPIGAARLVGGLSAHRGDGFAPIVAADRGTVDRRAPFRQASGRLRLLAPVGSAELKANLSAFDDRRDRGVDFTTSRGRGIDGSLRLVGRDWSLLGYRQHRRFESDFASVGAGRDSVAQALDQFDVPATGMGAKAEWRPRAAWADLLLSADWRRTRGSTNERYLFSGGVPGRQREAGAATTTAGLAASARWQSGSTTLGVGGRLDRWWIENSRLFEQAIGGATITDATYADRSGVQPSVQIGIDHRLSPRWSVRAAAYRSWRLPTVNELVRPFRVGADAVAANARLGPERLLGIEAGVDWTPAAQSKIRATVFANRLSGAIANVAQGEGPGQFPGVGFVAEGGTYRRRENLDRIGSVGVELDGEWRRGAWSLTGSLALTRARITDGGLAQAIDGERPGQVPAVQAQLGGAWERAGRLFGLSARFVGAQDESEGDAEALPSALTFDAIARWPVARRLALELRGENLLDRQVLTAVAADGTRERASPRTLWLGLRLD